MTVARHHRDPAAIPTFEGKDVDLARVKLDARTTLDIDGVFRVDDIVQVLVEARVTAVNHNVNGRTGLLERVQTLSVLSVDLAPWTDGDDGVLRA